MTIGGDLVKGVASGSANAALQSSLGRRDEWATVIAFGMAMVLGFVLADALDKKFSPKDHARLMEDQA